MSSRRRLDAEHPGYDPGACDADGRAQCRRCLGALPHPHAMFCGPACEHEFRIRSSPAYARHAVYRRDRGVCMHCRLDCGMLDRIIARLRSPDASAAIERDAIDVHAGPRVEEAANDDGEGAALWLIEELGLGKSKRCCSLWQVDHRVPFSTGGADCGLGNLRTLCLECHKAQTKQMHRRGKAERQE